jgi:hypothetical protein
MSTIFAYDTETHVAVPKAELEKLEQARVELFSWLADIGFFGETLSYEHTVKLSNLCSITKQIWEVANRKKWGI